MFYRALILRMFYRYGFPFTTSIVLAVLTAAWPYVRQTRFHEGTSIWTIALFVTASTAFAMLCGGRFRTFFVAIAVTPPFLVVLPLWVHSVLRHPDYPVKGFVEYLLYFVAAPIVLVWVMTKLFSRKEESM